MDLDIVFSGIQPSGGMTLGNYIGVLRPWAKIQYEYECIYCIADLHAITTRQNIQELSKRSLDMLAMFLACGIDPMRTIIFIQSHIPHHAQLCWLLSCFCYFGEMKRMVQFKDKFSSLDDSGDKVNIGLFSYPILMAADILLYQTNLVPIGYDQKQHLELSRKIANRFNSMYGKIFTVPIPYLSNFGSRIMSLCNPLRKMSKSDVNKRNVIFLLEGIQSVIDKLNGAVTDSDYPPKIYYDPVNKPGISNLLVILSEIENVSVFDLELLFKGKQYVQLKHAVIEALVKQLKILQERYFVFRKDEHYLRDVLFKGSKKAFSKADNMLVKVYNAVGLF